MVKYLGSKRKLLGSILSVVDSLPDVRTALDLFSGTSRVARELKRRGIFVTANDHNAYAHTLATAYVEADADKVALGEAIAELNALPGKPGWLTETYCERSRYFQPHNGARIDAIRDRIEEWRLDPVSKAVLLTSLLEAADRVDSTTGVQMAYLKSWSARSHGSLEMRMPELLPGPGKATQLEALEAAPTEVDLVYMDPPYNQHSYLGNYHLWETLVKWDQPEVYGVACKRADCRTRSSSFNSKVRFQEAFQAVVSRLRCRFLLVSFSDDGFLDLPTMLSVLGREGDVQCHEVDYPRYVGARIGIYSPSGERVGSPGRLRTCERLFLVSRGDQGRSKNVLTPGLARACDPASGTPVGRSKTSVRVAVE